jgi:phage terminase large subunit GpA-like protein
MLHQRLSEYWNTYWQPPAQLNPWQWAEANLEFSSRSSAYPGRYRSTLTPYVQQILEDFKNPTIRKVVLCWGAQSAKTTTLSVALAYTIDQAPGPALFVMPSLDMARSFSENRLQPMIEDCSTLARHKTDNRHDFKKTEFILDRSSIYLQGANSANQLASRPIKYLFADEVDKWPEQTSKEADALSLAVERVKTYRDHKVVISSTPTVPAGQIWQNFIEGDQRLYMLPCPLCGSMFALEWEHIHWPETKDTERIRKETTLQCPHCNGHIAEKHKATMLQHGQWQAQNPQAPPEVRSYHLSELYSPWTRWGSLAVKFIQANEAAKKGSPGALHNFVNSSLAQPWEPREGQRNDENNLLQLRDDRPRGLVPRDTLGITAAVDVQDHGFWYIVRAWGKDLESWLLYEGFLPNWDSVTDLLTRYELKDSAGEEYKINFTLIDSGGHRTAEVYDFCRRYPGTAPSKGEQRMAQPWKLSKLDHYPGSGAVIPGGLKLYRLNTTYYKDMLQSKTQIAAADPGAFHLHEHIQPESDYIKHMCAEYRDDHGVWRCPGSRRNDMFDCEAMALAAADIIRVANWKPRTPQKNNPEPPQRNIRSRGVSRNKPGWFEGYLPDRLW